MNRRHDEISYRHNCPTFFAVFKGGYTRGLERIARQSRSNATEVKHLLRKADVVSATAKPKCADPMPLGQYTSVHCS